ncbi:NAD-dependent epimerase/dehydratase family protein [Silvimonas soli]|uniref:NAD-dependent epimerase/dehydratase family protein n=1 Tax=Silvimonas soli TaxID=2980100 RepID=UPI0024B34372|nr:NAD-dependent epimerase/dehydratase family protein [Silvimonas soli]
MDIVKSFQINQVLPINRIRSRHLMRPRLLIAGCGDVISRALPWLLARFQVFVICRREDQAVELRHAGAHVLRADLDDASTLSRLGGLRAALIHSAPPVASGEADLRTHKLLAALQKSSARPQKRPILAYPTLAAVYISTTGVYGNADGQWLDECAPLRPDSARAQRRVSAEQQMRTWARRAGRRLSILRAPGIYAEGRLPVERVRRGDPSINPAEDSWSNHIHADDLAHAVCLALFRGKPLRAYNAVDDHPTLMGDWFDQVADACDLPRPPRIARSEASQQLSPALMSYLNESRKLRNCRIKRELRLHLRWPTTMKYLHSQISHKLPKVKPQ